MEVETAISFLGGDVSGSSDAWLYTTARYYVVTTMIHRPNKSPEPTAVGAVRSAVAVHVTSRRWLSFFR